MFKRCSVWLPVYVCVCVCVALHVGCDNGCIGGGAMLVFVWHFCNWPMSKLSLFNAKLNVYHMRMGKGIHIPRQYIYKFLYYDFVRRRIDSFWRTWSAIVITARIGMDLVLCDPVNFVKVWYWQILSTFGFGLEFWYSVCVCVCR